jgi:hypothetical protein
MKTSRSIAPVVKILDIHTPHKDYDFWITRSYQERLDTLENIRNEYHLWRFGAEPRFQRVFKIIKR